MKKPLDDLVRLEHIIRSIDKIERYVDNLSYDDFYKSDIHKSAVTNELMIIGEAVSRLSETIKDDFSETEWKGIKNLRNLVVHEYFAIDYSVIWELLKYNLTDLKKEIQGILGKIK
ncbi:MAG: HepT-like ribonuclease domain-containing protein [Ignavibacteria bacterium]